MEPRLMTSADGAQAVLLRCRPFLTILAELTPTRDPGGRGLLSLLGCDDGWLAVLDAVPDRGTALLVEALVRALEGEGHILDAVATIGDGPGAVPPGLTGFEPIANAEVGGPDLMMRFYRAPHPNAALREGLSADRPGPRGEPAGHLRRRSEWFQRRTGRQD